MSIVWSKEQDGSIFANVAGKVIWDAKTYKTKTGSTMAVFSVRHVPKGKIKVVVFGDDDDPIKQTAVLLEKGDVVSVQGRLTTSQRDGEPEEEIKADFISVMMHPAAAPSVDGQDGWDDAQDDEEHPF